MARFCNYTHDTKIILAKGAEHPLEGDLHSAQYFHGRYVNMLPLDLLLSHRQQRWAWRRDKTIQ